MGYTIHNDDCIAKMHELAEQGFQYDLSVFSPPFASLFSYSEDPHDMGNSRDSDDEFLLHYEFFANAIYPLSKPGRNTVVHLQQITRTKGDYGHMGLFDIRGHVNRIMQAAGFILYGEVCVPKNPQAQSIRLKAHQLQFTQWEKDSTVSRPALADWVQIYKKPGENEVPVKPLENGLSRDLWIKWAEAYWQSDQDRLCLPASVWFDINETHVLNNSNSVNRVMGGHVKRGVTKFQHDEKHMCLAPSCMILTQRGYVPIADVEIGDLTLTHKGRWRKIIAKQQTRKDAQVVQVKAHGVPELIVTPNHRLWARKHKGYRHRETMRQSSPDWLEADRSKSHYLNQKTPPEIQSPLSEKEWWLIGRWIADGHVDSRGYQYFVSIGKDKMPEFAEKAGDFIGVKNENTAVQVGLVRLSSGVRDVLSRCGRGAGNKKLPIEAISLNSTLSEALLSGYLSGDGHEVWPGKWTASSISRGLLLGMSIVAQKARSVTCSVYAGKPAGDHVIEGRNVNQQQQWVMTFTDGKNSASLLEDGAWKKVRSVESVGSSDVWNIRVEEDESYTAEGCVVKNCPLQLDLIERAVLLWSNAGETVFSPFGGIGSEGVGALMHDRDAVLIELNERYVHEAERIMDALLAKRRDERRIVSLFDLATA